MNCFVTIFARLGITKEEKKRKKRKEWGRLWSSNIVPVKNAQRLRETGWTCRVPRLPPYMRLMAKIDVGHFGRHGETGYLIWGRGRGR